MQSINFILLFKFGYTRIIIVHFHFLRARALSQRIMTTRMNKHRLESCLFSLPLDVSPSVQYRFNEERTRAICQINRVSRLEPMAWEHIVECAHRASSNVMKIFVTDTEREMKREIALQEDTFCIYSLHQYAASQMSSSSYITSSMPVGTWIIAIVKQDNLCTVYEVTRLPECIGITLMPKYRAAVPETFSFETTFDLNRGAIDIHFLSQQG